jgi:thioredoxin-related protein
MKLLKHSTFIVIIQIVLISCNKKESLEIHSSLRGLEDGTTVILIDKISKSILDSTYVKDNHFTLNGGTLQEPRAISINVYSKKKEKYIELFVGNEEITIDGDIDKLLDGGAINSLDIKGSVHNLYKAKLDSLTYGFSIQLNKLQAKLINQMKNGMTRDSMMSIYWGKNGVFTKIQAEREKVEKTFIEEHINSFYALYILARYRNKDFFTKEEVRQFISKVGNLYKNSIYGDALITYLKVPVAKENDYYYDFVAEDLHGNDVRLTKIIGDNYTLLNFASPYCSFSERATISLNQLLEKDVPKVKIINFYIDGSKEVLKEYAKKNNIRGTIIHHKYSTLSKAYTVYGKEGITPTFYLIDKNGKIIKKKIGFFGTESFNTQVTSLIK